jgi:hypothetical protein
MGLIEVLLNFRIQWSDGHVVVGTDLIHAPVQQINEFPCQCCVYLFN